MQTAGISKQRQEMLRKQRNNKIMSVVAPIVTFAIVLLIWEVLVIKLEIPTWKIPRPSAAFYSMVVDFETFLPHIIRSYTTIIFGYIFAVIVGIALAALLSNFKILAAALTPYLNLLCTTPVMTLVPLLLLWLGFGQWVMVLAVTVQAFPILNMNASTGFNNVETLRLELMQSMRASRIQTFFHCTLPASLPSVFTGMKLSGIFATTACISSEFSGGSRGLGAQIIANTQFMRMDMAFACIFYVAIIGVALYMIVSIAESKIIKWKI